MIWITVDLLKALADNGNYDQDRLYKELSNATWKPKATEQEYTSLYKPLIGGSEIKHCGRKVTSWLFSKGMR